MSPGLIFLVCWAPGALLCTFFAFEDWEHRNRIYSWGDLMAGILIALFWGVVMLSWLWPAVIVAWAFHKAGRTRRGDPARIGRILAGRSLQDWHEKREFRQAQKDSRNENSALQRRIAELESELQIGELSS